MKNATPAEVFAEVLRALEPGAFRDRDGNYDFTEAELTLKRVRDVAVLQRIALAATQLAGMAALAHGDRIMLEQRRRTGTFAPGDLAAGVRANDTGEEAMIAGRFSSYSNKVDNGAYLTTTLHSVLCVKADSLRHIGDDGVMVPLPEHAAVTA
jgi:hypothetical protein